MTWKETDTLTERTKFIADWLSIPQRVFKNPGSYTVVAGVLTEPPPGTVWRSGPGTCIDTELLCQLLQNFVAGFGGRFAIRIDG